MGTFSCCMFHNTVLLLYLYNVLLFYNDPICKSPVQSQEITEITWRSNTHVYTPLGLSE